MTRMRQKEQRVFNPFLITSKIALKMAASSITPSFSYKSIGTHKGPDLDALTFRDTRECIDQSESSSGVTFLSLFEPQGLRSFELFRIPKSYQGLPMGEAQTSIQFPY